MVYEALELIRSELEVYIKSFDTTATVQLGSIAASGTPQGNTVLIGLVNIEEESTLKNTSPYQRTPTGSFDIRNPPVFLNIYTLISAGFSGDNGYGTALKLLSWTIQCFQRKSQFTVSNTPAATSIDSPQALTMRITVDFCSPSFERLNQLWGTLGGKQVPSVLYKIRVVEEQAEGQLGASTPILAIEGRAKSTNQKPG